VLLDSSSGPKVQICSPGTPELLLTLSFGGHHNSRALVISLVPGASAIDTRFFVITLAGLGFSFSSNRNVTFVSSPAIEGSAYLNTSSLVMNVSMHSSWNFPQNEPIIFAFGDLESAWVTEKHSIQSAVFSSNGTCLLQSNLGFSPSVTLFPTNLPKRYMLQCESALIDNKGFC
jgi:hypothetical protein